MEPNAHIVVSSSYCPDPIYPTGGYHAVDAWRWEGGDVAAIDWHALPHGWDDAQVGATHIIGPWHVTIIAVREWRMDVLVTRRQGLAWLYILRWRCVRVYDWVKHRVIATAAIWGLGCYDWARTAAWSDIYAVARVQAVMGRVTGYLEGE
jgi:hypothetical protein